MSDESNGHEGLFLFKKSILLGNIGQLVHKLKQKLKAASA